jgi:hypothetical protein
MISNRRLDIHIPVAMPEADRDVHPRLRFGFTSRTPMRATDNSRRRRDIGKRPIHQRWPDGERKRGVKARECFPLAALCSSLMPQA